MINEAALAMEYGASCEDIARVCHAHPVRPATWHTEHSYISPFNLSTRRTPQIIYRIVKTSNDKIIISFLSFHPCLHSSSLSCLSSTSCRLCQRPSEKQTWLPLLAKPSTFDLPAMVASLVYITEKKQEVVSKSNPWFTGILCTHPNCTAFSSNVI